MLRLKNESAQPVCINIKAALIFLLKSFNFLPSPAWGTAEELPSLPVVFPAC